MTNINLDPEIYKKWFNFYKKQSKIKYPTFKNFTERKLLNLLNEES